MAKRKVRSESSSATITASLETIGLKWASDTLSAQRRNRPIKQSKVKGLAKAILDGKWTVNGESIILDSDGVLIDGQHRLAALIYAIEKLKGDESTTIDAVVVKGVSPDAFHTIDQGEKRSLADVVAISQFACAPELAVALRLLAIRLSRKKISGVGKLDHADNLKLLQDHADLAAWVEYVADLKSDNDDASWLRPQSLISVGYLATISYLAAMSYDTPEVEQFLKHLCDQDHDAKDCPAVALRKALLKNRSDRDAKLKRDTLVNLVVKAMNTYLSGEKATTIKLKEGEHPLFPAEEPSDASESDSDE